MLLHPGEDNKNEKIEWKGLTIDNIKRFAKSGGGGEQSRSDSAARMWLWLADAGPPYDAQPSVGVNTCPLPKSSSQSKSRRYFSCFRCFA